MHTVPEALPEGSGLGKRAVVVRGMSVSDKKLGSRDAGSHAAKSSLLGHAKGSKSIRHCDYRMNHHRTD